MNPDAEPPKPNQQRSTRHNKGARIAVMVFLLLRVSLMFEIFVFFSGLRSSSTFFFWVT